MRVTYSPESGDRRTWRFNPGKVPASKGEMIERRYGESWDQWRLAIQTGSIRARRVLLWHLMTTDHPAFRWEDTPDFAADELEVEYDAAELRKQREQVERSGAIPAEDRPGMLAAYDGMIAEAEAKDQAASDDVGKASSPTDGSTTA